MLYGITLIDDLPFRLVVDATLRKGSGEVYISGPVEPSIEEVINESIGFGNVICDLDDRPLPDLSTHDLHIRIRLPAISAPVVGPSYGLLLSLEIIFALTQTSPGTNTYVTGAINSDGDVLPVGGIAQKRKGAAALGGRALVLPSAQFDFFSTDIIQIPVSSIYQAYSVLQYGDENG